jgi:acetylornithine/N-succinyldiaminopimelate aminotransferase
MSASIMKMADRTLAATYTRFPLVLTRGSGCTLWDGEGRADTDFVAGIAVCNLGHAHPKVAAAVARQAETLVHVSNLYYTVPQVELAEWLTERCFADRVFFCNSGAEANEAAIKLARKAFYDAGRPERFRIIAAEKSFHGRTLATLSATGQEKIRKGFDPVLQGFDFVPFGDAEALAKAVGPETCAVLLEPIQGEGGVNRPDPEYLGRVREVCDREGILMILDEIQTGMGRTGTLFAHEQSGVRPDIMTLAKALANGLPMGAMLARETVAAAFGPGSHATTFGGTPLVSAAALATVRALEAEDLVARSRTVGAYFRSRLEALRDRHARVLSVRGAGLLLGMALDGPAADVVAACMENGFLVNCVQETVLRFAPPLVIEKSDIDRLVDCLDRVL